ncbi:hypothetical protein [Maledivibacter halophilus]|uniref:hypothetical protein n=1 Tax=Maledivibacter halophilus TaxID=36842 RepID=UPI001AD8C4C5|nr:hypothetical protein [Maledivibacter halophilus]
MNCLLCFDRNLLNKEPNNAQHEVDRKVTKAKKIEKTKATQISQFDLVLEKNGNNWRIVE